MLKICVKFENCSWKLKIECWKKNLKTIIKKLRIECWKLIFNVSGWKRMFHVKKMNVENKCWILKTIVKNWNSNVEN